MCLPKVVWITPRQMVEDMGHPEYSAYYDPEPNIVFLNTGFPLRFSTLFHELVHWALCFLPKTDRVYEVNLLYDILWDDLRRIVKFLYYLNPSLR